MIQFEGFKPEAMKKIQGKLGFQGYPDEFDAYLEQNPDKKATMDQYEQKALEMVNGGHVVKLQGGGDAEAERRRLGIDAQGRKIPYGQPGSTLPPPDLVVGPPVGGPALIDLPDNGPPPADPPPQSPGLPPVGPPVGINPPEASPPGEVDPDDPITLPPGLVQPPVVGQTGQLGNLMAQRAQDPRLTEGTAVQPVGTTITQDQLVDPNTGQLPGNLTAGTVIAGTQQATAPTDMTAATYDADTTEEGVRKEVGQLQPAQGTIGVDETFTGEESTETMVSDLEAAQGKPVLIDQTAIPRRKLEFGEVVTGQVNPMKAAEFTEQIQAANATPSKQATVKGQLAELMQEFDGGESPPWAAGAIRAANNAMLARGMGASSMAGQAILQAAMESALPIASSDAQMFGQFEAQNLSNKQQRAMLAAEQRAKFMGQKFDQDFQAQVANAAKVSDIANMNFTAEQQVMLENSKIANTMELNNLSNKQALVMGEAAALANLDVSNLNNRQQAAVENAQKFMQMNMANVDKEQQTSIFKSQQMIQSLFTDSAAVNASQQFNATSENQTNQFFENLKNTTSQFNASQANAQAKFNAGEANAQELFNTDLKNNREQFNANNRLVIDQNNAVWRREVATADTVAINRANELNASALLDISNTAYKDLWNYYGDSMEFAWTAADNAQERIKELAIAELNSETQLAMSANTSSTAMGSAIGNLIGTLGSAWISGMFPATTIVTG